MKGLFEYDVVASSLSTTNSHTSNHTTMSAFSLYIPGVYANITEEMIKKTFNRMKIGVVNRAILIPQSNLKHNKAYIYFDEMYNTSTVSTMLSEIKEGSSKLFYARTPHVYWVMLENRRPIQDDERMPAAEIESEMIVEEEEEETPTFSEEEEAFVPIEDTSMVSSDYAAMLERELSILREEKTQLQINSHTMFEYYNQLLYTNQMLNAQLMHQNTSPMEVGNQQFQVESTV